MMMKEKTGESMKQLSFDGGSAKHSVRVFASKELLSDDVGSYVAAIAQDRVKKNGTFTVALSGGSLPKLLASGLLKSLHSQSDEDAKRFFSAWHVFFADERCVPLASEDSNFKGCVDAFLGKIPIPRANVHTIDASLKTPEDMAKAYEKDLVSIAGASGALDLVLLGMGPDGHTCSLFPGHELLKESSRLVAHIVDSPKLPPKRITLTYPALRASRNVAFVAAGSSKADVLPKVFAKGSDLPAAGAYSKSMEAVWFVDDAAAARLVSASY